MCESERKREKRKRTVNNRNKINSFHCFISILVKCVVDRNLAATHIRRGAGDMDRNSRREMQKVKCLLKIGEIRRRSDCTTGVT